MNDTRTTQRHWTGDTQSGERRETSKRQRRLQCVRCGRRECSVWRAQWSGEGEVGWTAA